MTPDCLKMCLRHVNYLVVILGPSGLMDGMSPPPGRVKSPVVEETIEEDEPEEESYELADRRVLQVAGSPEVLIASSEIFVIN